MAQEKRLFAQCGLEGELLYINSGSMNIAALVGGSLVSSRRGCRSWVIPSPFAAVANGVDEEANARGGGKELPTERFTRNVHP